MEGFELLTKLIQSGKSEIEGKKAKELLGQLFGQRYHKRHFEKTIVRDALGFGDEYNDQNVPFAGLIHADNPESGPYGGMSLVWFPSNDNGSIIGFGVGTRGLSPDEGILTRPGHKRRVASLRRKLAKAGVTIWTKPDPANLNITVPKTVIERFPGFEKAFKRYGREMYCFAQVPNDNDVLANQVISAFFDLYSYERGWDIQIKFKQQRDELLGRLRQDLFQKVHPKEVVNLLKLRRFVILEGPPGTGKTFLTEQVKNEYFIDSNMTVQFHPSITYEDFLIGLSPDTNEKSLLRFDIKAGWLLKACEQAKNKPFLLVIDEINRADLGKILGEAIYLFESGEIGKRSVELPHPYNEKQTLELPDNLYVLGTMNTSDRSIASIDMAIRRRFAFMKIMPEREVVSAQENELATKIFDLITDVFIEHAPNEALNLLPGHSYYLASTEDEAKQRFKYELLPLLDEYIRDGHLGPATTELNAVRDIIEDIVQ